MINERLLTRTGYDVFRAKSVAMAMEVLETQGAATFSMVLSDYRMPDESGLILLRKVKLLDPSLAVIIATAQGDKDAVASFLREGAIGYLDKPIDSILLREDVAKACEHTARQRNLRVSNSRMPSPSYSCSAVSQETMRTNSAITPSAMAEVVMCL